MKRIICLLAAVLWGFQTPALCFAAEMAAGSGASAAEQGPIPIMEPLWVDFEQQDYVALTGYLERHCPGFDPAACKVAYAFADGEGGGRVHYRVFYNGFMTRYSVIVHCEKGEPRSYYSNVDAFQMPQTVPKEASYQNLAPFIREAQITALQTAGWGAEDALQNKDFRVYDQSIEVLADDSLNPYVAVGTVYQPMDGRGRFYPRTDVLLLNQYTPFAVKETAHLTLGGAVYAMEWVRTEEEPYVKLRDLAQAGYVVGSAGNLPLLQSPPLNGREAAEGAAGGAEAGVSQAPPEAGAQTIPAVSEEIVAKARVAAMVDFGFGEENGNIKHWLTEQSVFPYRDRDGRICLLVVSRYLDTADMEKAPITVTHRYYTDALSGAAPEGAMTDWRACAPQEIPLTLDSGSRLVNRILLEDTNYIALSSLRQAGIPIETE